jgi:hypothetical protein
MNKRNQLHKKYSLRVPQRSDDLTDQTGRSLLAGDEGFWGEHANIEPKVVQRGLHVDCRL